MQDREGLGSGGQQPAVGGGAVSLKAGVVEVVVRCWGRAGLALLDQPQPVTPRHLETIMGNNEGSGEPGCSGIGALALSVRRAKKPAARRHLLPVPPPSLSALALDTYTGPTGPAVRRSQPLSYNGGRWKVGCPEAWPEVRRSQPA